MTPVLWRWSGEAMVPLPRFASRCDRDFVVGEIYRMEAIEERSLKSHSHYFASLHDRWMSLPDHTAERFPTVEHLRKYALIKSGYADQRQIVCASKAEAQRVAGFIRPMDEYAIVAATEAVVTVWTAQSQSFKAMGRKVFQESKDKVFGVIDDLLGLKKEREAA